jgi:nucleotide-binding universal stress UspA family protein
MNFRHILLTTDLSPESLHPCLSVAGLAKESKAKVTLLHVVHELHVVPHGAPMAPPIAPLDLSGEIKHAELALADQRAVLGKDVEVVTAVVTGERVHDAVVDYAKRHGVDLIAIATHGRTGFRHFALGSVAEAIIRHSPIPVLCFPRAEKK